MKIGGYRTTGGPLNFRITLGQFTSRLELKDKVNRCFFQNSLKWFGGIRGKEYVRCVLTYKLVRMKGVFLRKTLS